MTPASFHGRCLSNSNNAWNLGDAYRIPAFFAATETPECLQFRFFCSSANSIQKYVSHSALNVSIWKELNWKSVKSYNFKCDILHVDWECFSMGKYSLKDRCHHPASPKQSYQRQRGMYPIYIQMKMYVRHFRLCARFDTVFDMVRWPLSPYARGEHRFLWMIWMIWSLHQSAFGFRIDALGVVTVHRVWIHFAILWRARSLSKWKNQMKH